jgi:hypothetical protein
VRTNCCEASDTLWILWLLNKLLHLSLGIQLSSHIWLHIRIIGFHLALSYLFSQNTTFEHLSKEGPGSSYISDSWWIHEKSAVGHFGSPVSVRIPTCSVSPPNPHGISWIAITVTIRHSSQFRSDWSFEGSWFNGSVNRFSHSIGEVLEDLWFSTCAYLIGKRFSVLPDWCGPKDAGFSTGNAGSRKIHPLTLFIWGPTLNSLRRFYLPLPLGIPSSNSVADNRDSHTVASWGKWLAYWISPVCSVER